MYTVLISIVPHSKEIYRFGDPQERVLNWSGLISRDKYEHTHLRLWIENGPRRK